MQNNKIMHMVTGDGVVFLMEGHDQVKAREVLGEEEAKIELLYTSRAATTGTDRIVSEREEQLAVGYTPGHDTGYNNDEVLRAALAYAHAADQLAQGAAAHEMGYPNNQVVWSAWWPWGDEFWKPGSDPEHCAVKAGALLAAWLDARALKKGGES